ncbi:nicotinate-nucleotide diphosphorylase (carboxylating) [Bacteriovorax sp. BAL6_X]|uniref:carboxylating nicotinate-nucleotide diphosphorylase n=1 Tax=Bacteriovorax sp. BAL6_X TaxID=1201290 RepID=UPI000385CE05|nr:carboxylating nicotinate-nucleotide diphosphorylase [Bacteriovorax sp. BAL6_X]EPZ51971.1 nicotinate-nucleotide diphosphorylase (carboxylating) [Bacteriovorax sp. BAL6_X]
MNLLVNKALQDSIEIYFKEDDLSRNLNYIQSLPNDEVHCKLKIKDDMILCGLPYFIESFNYLGANLKYEDFKRYEGQKFTKDEMAEIEFKLPFSIALTGERIALNLIQRASSIATYTNKFATLALDSGVKILDTRKTLPGYRALEKYAVVTGGGNNHRFGQSDMWMVKDNHKSFFGGVKEAIDFFKSKNSFYTPIEVEIHDLNELQIALGEGVRHIMLDNFSPEEIKEAVKKKPEGVTFEVSGGVRLNTLESYLIEGVDAISIGALTYDAPAVDLSLKYARG